MGKDSEAMRHKNEEKAKRKAGKSTARRSACTMGDPRKNEIDAVKKKGGKIDTKRGEQRGTVGEAACTIEGGAACACVHAETCLEKNQDWGV